MDKISLLKTRRTSLLEKGSDVRSKIAALIDGESFVELDSYSFSRNEFYGEDVEGEGVVTGFATVNDIPVYVVAINPAVLSGGLGNAGCKKIVKCLDKAYVAGAPVIYLLSSKGVLAGEGVASLEGVAEVLAKMNELSGEVPQFTVSYGDVFGSAALMVAEADYNYFIKGACVSYQSPLVVAAQSGVSADKNAIGGAETGNGLASFVVENIDEARNGIANILDLLPDYGGEVLETMDDLNRSSENLNEKACAKCLINAVFDKDYFVELNKNVAKEVVTGIGRIGGYSAAAIIFNGENGVELTKENVEKVKNFIYYATDNGFPIVTFVNTVGLKADKATATSTVLSSISSLLCAFGYAADVARINVIYGKAVGLGYTLFASKAHGADYSFAFANAEISPVSSAVGAEMEFVTAGGDKDALKQRYQDENADAMNAAKNGFIDDVIEPQFVRQYIVSALQMLVG